MILSQFPYMKSFFTKRNLAVDWSSTVLSLSKYLRQPTRFYFSLLLCLLFSISSNATTWHVGPSRTYTYCSQVATLVQNGDSILIDKATYVNDPQVKWSKNNLYIAGIGGRPRLEAGSIIANDMSNGKGIFVISGSNVHVHNIEFANAVVQDHNGAGIRQEGPNLWVTNCFFNGNEMGILCGSIPNCKTTVEYSEFVNNGSPANPGYQHNIYINHIDTLVFRYNYTHEAIAEGHELKSRATYNFILYNRIANEWSEDSRTIDLPNGGTSVIVGNIIEQGPNSANHNIIGYGLEGLTNPAPNVLFCCSNTIINKNANGSFIQVANGTDTLFLKNNILAGAKTNGLIIGNATVVDSSNNEVNNLATDMGFVDVLNYDYHLTPSSVAINKGINIPRTVLGNPLQPYLEYKDTCDFEPKMLEGILDIGTYEYPLPLATIENATTEFSIYPNPAKSDFTINVTDLFSHIQLSIVNPAGKTIITKELQAGNNKIDISGWNSGMYFLILHDKLRKEVRKLVIK